MAARNGDKPDAEVIPGVEVGDKTLEDLIDERFRHLLSLTAEPKDLVKALEAASAWMKIRRDLKEPEWGKELGRTMRP